MRALVTGGCGFIGSNLVHKLVETGWTVDIVDSLVTGRLENLDDLRVRPVISALSMHIDDRRGKDDVVFFETDIEDRHVLDRIRDGRYDVVFHLAANPRVSQTVENPAATTDVNCTRSLSLIEAVRDCKPPLRLVFSSTCALYGDAEIPTGEDSRPKPSSPYGLQKLFVEDYIRIAVELHGIDAVSLRYFNVYGPRQYGDSAYATAITAWCNCVKNGNSLRSDGDGEQSRDMVFVGDVVRANLLAATRTEPFRGQAYNIGTGRSYSNNEILDMFRLKFGKINVSNAPARVGDIKHTRANTEQAATNLGFVSQVDLARGLEMTWKWWGL
jgi:UDP-glucose 4-epimerase